MMSRGTSWLVSLAALLHFASILTPQMPFHLIAETAPQVPGTDQEQTGIWVESATPLDFFVYDIAFSPDGTYLAAVGNNNKVHLWKVLGSDPIRTLTLQPKDTTESTIKFACHAVVFAADGKRLAAADDVGSIWVCNVADGGVAHRLYGQFSQDHLLEFSPNARVLASGNSQGTVKLWDLDTGTIRTILETDGAISSLAFSTDVRTLAIAQRAKTVQVWNVATDRMQAFAEKATQLAYTPDGRRLILGTEHGQLKALEAATGKVVGCWQAHAASIRSLAISFDGKLVASVAGGNPKVLIFDCARASQSQAVAEFTTWGVSAGIEFSPVKRTLATGGVHGVQLWNWLPVAEALPLLWQNLGYDDGRTVHQAVRDLVKHPQATVPFLRQRVKPVPPALLRHIAALVADLDSNNFETRNKAVEELEKVGHIAISQLARVREGKPSLEMKVRVELLLDKLHQRPPTTEELRQLRAVEVLEYIGTPDACSALQELADGASEAELTQLAHAALARLHKLGPRGPDRENDVPATKK